MKSLQIAELRVAPTTLRALAIALTLLVSAEAHAAGLFIAPRGVRPLGRAGAFVAGADDVHALTYNPAGLAFATNQVLLDLAFNFYTVDFTRRVTADSEPLPTVTGEALKLPLPNIGFVHDFGLGPMLTFGASLGADTPGLQTWPSELPDGSPAPQRYAIEEYNGTAIVKLAAGAAVRPIPQLAFGLSLQAMVGTFADTKSVSACDGVICTQAEDPLHDTRIQLVAKNIFSPGIHVGVIGTPTDWLKIGIAWESGYRINRVADLNVRLPAAGEYDAATLEPAEPKARVRLSLPWSARFGVEARSDLVRVELAAVHDHWSSFDQVTFSPQDVRINNVLAIGDYRLAELFIEPRFKNVWSFRLGSEWTPEIDGARDLVLRAGAFYEPSAIPDERLSPEWVDLDKLFITGGAGYRLGRVALDGTIAYGILESRSIRNSQALQLNPLRPAFSGRTALGNGDYSASNFIIGLSVRYFLAP